MPAYFHDVNIDDPYLIAYLNKMKRNKFPKSPKTSEEIISAFEKEDVRKMFGEHYETTVKPEQKGIYGFSIFCDYTIIESMKNITNREILIDATFDVVPDGPYKQLLVIHLAYENNVI